MNINNDIKDNDYKLISLSIYYDIVIRKKCPEYLEIVFQDTIHINKNIVEYKTRFKYKKEYMKDSNLYEGSVVFIMDDTGKTIKHFIFPVANYVYVEGFHLIDENNNDSKCMCAKPVYNKIIE